MRHLPLCFWITISCTGLAAQAIPVRGLQGLQEEGRATRAHHQAQYAQKIALLKPDDIQTRLTLALWCKKQNLFPEMRSTLVPVLEADPDQPQARALLGQLKVGQKWLPKAKAFKAMGYTYYKAAWHSPEAMKVLRAEAARKRHMDGVRSDLQNLARILVGPNDRRSERARRDFLALVRKERLHHLGYKAEMAWYRSRQFWKKHRSALVHDRVRGTIAIRAQMSKLLGFENYTTSLGTGSPVTIQLPRTRSISIGTTVPFGR